MLFKAQQVYFQNRLDFQGGYYAKQNWDIFNDFWKFISNEIKKEILYNFYYAKCFHCKKHSIWVDNKMIYPLSPSGPMPSKDMPENVKKIYEEARKVGIFSLRAAAALLRVALEELCAHLGEKDGTLYEKITNLKEKRLSKKAIESLHIVRIFANEGGSHSGQIDLEHKDNEGVVDKLFMLVNLIVEKTISEQKTINKFLSEIPENKKKKL